MKRFVALLASMSLLTTSTAIPANPTAIPGMPVVKDENGSWKKKFKQDDTEDLEEALTTLSKEAPNLFTGLAGLGMCAWGYFLYDSPSRAEREYNSCVTREGKEKCNREEPYSVFGYPELEGAAMFVMGSMLIYFAVSESFELNADPIKKRVVIQRKFRF